MATTQQRDFLEENRDLIEGPLLIVGSKMYDYDAADPRELFARFGVESVTGVDIADGDGVDIVADVCDTEGPLADHRGRYQTVMCMEMLVHVHDPFAVARAVDRLLAPGGHVVLSECIVRKISRMPVDHWRFTYSGLQVLFSGYEFYDERARMGLVREHGGALLPYDVTLPQVLPTRHPDETALGYQVRRVHRRFLARGVFRLSRLMPETTILAIARKPEAS